jgi:putative ABC transport system permease protein
MLVFWLMPSNTFRNLFGDIYGRDSGNIEMFFLSGIMLVVATTLLLIFNAELLARFVNRVGGRLGSLRPALATAIAYPMASRMRTGMTLAMFSLIIFSVTVMSTLNTNFNSMLLTSDATGGWDVTATTNLNNPIPDLKGALQQSGVDTSKFTAVGATSPYTTLTDVRNAGDASWQRYNLRAADNAFLDAATLKLQAHAKGTAAADAWKTLEREPGTAIVDSLAVSGNPSSGDDQPNFALKGVKANATVLDKPVTIEVRNAAGQVSQLRVIGVINQVVGNTQFTVFTSGATYQQALGVQPDFSWYSIRLAKGVDDKAVAKEIKANLGAEGVQASAVRSDLKDAQAQNEGFSYLLEGFMGLGLLVGIAAVAVIAARTVVERRQQIGMLRAVGYKRSQVALSFALETSFIALFGIAAGVITAVILSYNLFTGNTFGDTSAASFTLPYLQIALFAGIAYLASLAMTYFPSRKAASLPIAQALRYE